MIAGHHRASIYTPKNYQPGQKSGYSAGLRPKFGTKTPEDRL